MQREQLNIREARFKLYCKLGIKEYIFQKHFRNKIRFRYYGEARERYEVRRIPLQDVLGAIDKALKSRIKMEDI